MPFITGKAKTGRVTLNDPESDASEQQNKITRLAKTNQAHGRRIIHRNATKDKERETEGIQRHAENEQGLLDEKADEFWTWEVGGKSVCAHSSV